MSPSEEQTALDRATLDALHQRLDAIQGRLDSLDRYSALFRHLGWFKILLSMVSAGMIGFWTPVLAVMSVVTPPIPTETWLFGCGTGALKMFMDLRNLLELPPTNGSTQLPARVQKTGA